MHRWEPDERGDAILAYLLERAAVAEHYGRHFDPEVDVEGAGDA